MQEKNDLNSLDKNNFDIIKNKDNRQVEPINKIFISKKFFNPKMPNKEEKSSIKFLSKKTMRFKVEKEEEYNKKKAIENLDINEGRWTKDEHDKFLDGIVQFGINWKKVKTFINSRTSIQVRSHAQKFFQKLKVCKDESLGIDFTLDSICNIKDIIDQIRTVK